MGYGEVIGNSSVHWKIVHQDLASGAPSGNQRSPDVVAVADAEVKGRDGILFDKIGTGKDEQGVPKDHTGDFRVRIRFSSLAAATAAANWAAQNIKREGNQFVLIVDVPAIERAKPTDPPKPEVRIDW